MSTNLYKFTIERVEDLKGNVTSASPLAFEARTHDDLFQIVEMMKGKVDFDEADVTAFAVGLKLFSGVMLKNKDNELFKRFKPHFSNFMKELKKSS